MGTGCLGSRRIGSGSDISDCLGGRPTLNWYGLQIHPEARRATLTGRSGFRVQGMEELSRSRLNSWRGFVKLFTRTTLQLMAMPVCPKCGHYISEEHWERHLRRCGEHHKHEPAPLVSTTGGVLGAAPYASEVSPPSAYPWWKFGRIVWPPHRMKRSQKLLLLLYLVLSLGLLSFIYFLLLSVL